MLDPSTARADDQVSAEVRDALLHYYDQAHLVQHPLLSRLQSILGPDPSSAVQELRRLLARAIQDLRPASDTPQSDAAWRPYSVLHRRFILARDLAQVERELSLGRRQLMREQRRGLQAVAAALTRQVAPRHDSGPLEDEVSRVAAQRQGLDLAASVRSAIGAVAALAERYSVHIEPLRAGPPVYVISSPMLLRQLIVASLSLAVRTRPESVIAVELGRESGSAFISLQVQGGALAAPAELPESLATLAQAQGGRISMSQDAGSLRLHVSLPAAAQERVVALVEDNLDVVHLFERALVGKGYRLLSITDSTAALDRIREEKPDAVVLDVMMADVDGWEILQRMRADPALSRLPVAICTVLDEPELAYSIGADAYLRKPVRAAQLLDCLAMLLAR